MPQRPLATHAPVARGDRSLAREIASAVEPALRGFVDRAGLGEEHALLIVRNRSVSATTLGALHADPRWARSGRVRAALARHSRTPRPIAMALLADLGWRDLATLAQDPFASPVVRVAAEQRLAEMAGDLALGEQIALARMVGRGLFRKILDIGREPVLEALLWNGKVTEEDLLPVARDGSTPRETLRALGSHRRWASRYALRLALARNPSTPPGTALGFLTSLRKADLEALWRKEGASKLVRLAAERLLREPGSRS